MEPKLRVYKWEIKGLDGADANKVFRGTWSPAVGYRPKDQPFLKVAMLAKPAPKPDAELEPPPPPPPPAQGAEITWLTEPPAEAMQEGAIRIFDRDASYRGFISRDGTCTNNCAEVIGYMNLEAGEAGSVDEEWLGCIQSGAFGDENHSYIQDANDEVVGRVDLGKSTLRDEHNRTVAEFTNAGEVKGHGGAFLGQFEPFSFRQIQIAALYLTLIDPGMLNEYA
jgi:hypothetical protein